MKLLWKIVNDFLCCIITIGKNYLWKTLILDKVMWICRGQELHAHPFPLFPFSSLLYLPTFHQSLPSPFLRSPSLTTLPSSSTSLPCPFRSSIYSSVPLNLPLSLSTFLFPSQPSSFPLNLPPSISTFPFPPTFAFPTFYLPYLSLSLLVSCPTYPLSSLLTSSIFPTSQSFPFFCCYHFPFIFPLPFF